MHYNASMCSHYIIHDDVLQVSRMMCLDVHMCHLDLDHNVTYMMTYNDDSSRRDLNLVENLVDDT